MFKNTDVSVSCLSFFLVRLLTDTSTLSSTICLQFQIEHVSPRDVRLLNLKLIFFWNLKSGRLFISDFRNQL